MVSNTFLAPIVEEVLALAEEIENEDTGGTLKTSDPTVLAWARHTYRRLMAYCNRPFESTTYIDRYDNIEERVRLRVTPVTSITSVRIINADSNMDTSDYELDINDLVFTNVFRSTVSGDKFLENLPRDLKVTYIAGMTLPTEDDQFMSAIVQQTLIWWKTRAILGLKKAVSDNVTTESSSKDMGLLPDVQDILSDYKYLGTGYEC